MPSLIAVRPQHLLGPALDDVVQRALVHALGLYVTLAQRAPQRRARLDAVHGQCSAALRPLPGWTAIPKSSMSYVRTIPIGLLSWTGSKEGDVDRLRLPYRLMLAEQGFVVIPRVEPPTGERQRSCCPPPSKYRLP
jgi:hypothetical protein